MYTGTNDINEADMIKEREDLNEVVRTIDDELIELKTCDTLEEFIALLESEYEEV